MRLLKQLALCCALAGSAVASVPAATLDNTFTYTGLVWAFSTGQPGFSGCGTLVLDATGAVASSDKFGMHGQLLCPGLGGSFAAGGTSFFDPVGFNMTISLSVTHQLVCGNLNSATLSGTCSIFDNVGNQTGTAFISFL
jgi:hypothetical protein